MLCGNFAQCDLPQLRLKSKVLCHDEIINHLLASSPPQLKLDVAAPSNTHSDSTLASGDTIGNIIHHYNAIKHHDVFEIECVK